MISIRDTSFKNTLLKLFPHLPGANELNSSFLCVFKVPIHQGPIDPEKAAIWCDF